MPGPAVWSGKYLTDSTLKICPKLFKIVTIIMQNFSQTIILMEDERGDKFDFECKSKFIANLQLQFYIELYKIEHFHVILP